METELDMVILLNNYEADRCNDLEGRPMRKIRYNKFGVAENPVGLQVRMNYNGLMIMGDVTGFYRDEVTGSNHLIVQHFNGDAWPIPPVANLVEVYDMADCATT